MENPQTSSAPELVGGPGDTMVAQLQNQPTPTPEAAPVVVPVAQSQPIYLGGKRFNSQEELVAYTTQLEQEKAILQMNAPSQAQRQIVQEAQAPKLSDLMFEDPEAYSKLILQQAKEGAKQEMTAQQANDKQWDAFFAKNPDLVDNQDIVEIKRREHFDRLKNLPPEQAFAELAKVSRSRLLQIKGQAGTERELPSGSAMVADGGSSQGIRVQAAPSTPKTFVEQLNAMKTRKKG